MEYVKGGELAKVLKRVGRLTESVARKVAMSLLFGIEYIHEKGIVHRDLKPANCLLTKLPAFMSEDGGGGGDHSSPMLATSASATIGDSASSPSSSPPRGSKATRRNRPEDFTEDDFGSLKIADFGFAALVGRAECLTNFCGTQHYMAPEVIRRDGLNYGKAVDIWSFGVILYLILSGEYPFSSTEQICHGKVQFLNSEANDHVWARISPQAKDFILRLLVVDPTKRPSATEALRHPWIKFEYSDSDEVSDYPTTKGIWRAHSKWLKTRKFEHRFAGAAHAVIFAHRLVFLARLQAMRREGIADISMLRHFPYIVHGIFEPTNHIAASGRRFVGNVAALRRLADMVCASLTVEVFDVSNSSIDDLSLIQHIVKVSYTHPSLICLNLENNPIPPLAGRALIRLARSLTHRLNVINVNNTNLGYETISQVDMCLKETIRKRAEAALALSCSTAGQLSSFSASSSSPSSIHGGLSRDVSSPVFGTRARTLSPHPIEERHLQNQRSIFQSNASPSPASSPTLTIRTPEPSSALGLRLSTPSPVGQSTAGRGQQLRRSQLPPLVELDLRARGAATNAVRQQRSGVSKPSV
jgi:serine/threonine protein kinase